MKKALLTTALIAALGTSATAQGIQPVATTPATDVTVGTALPAANIGFLALGVIAIGAIAALTDSTDGTN